MKKFICWEQRDVQEILNTDADYTPDYIFAAVHNPVTISKKLNDNNVGIPYTQENLLRDFTDSQNSHLIVPVLGLSGSGKSHLIHWLKTHIPSIPNKQEVLLIPKSGTNLKSILSLILRDRVGVNFDQYRKRLNQSSQQVEAKTGRERLLNGLATQISSLPLSYFEDRLGNSVDSFLLPLIKDELPDLLYDPHFRKQYWLKEGGVIARLYDHALGMTERERLEEKRQFHLNDLPIDMEDYLVAGEAAQKFVKRLLGSDEIQKACISFLNEALSDALKDLLIGGEDLTELMKDVRRQLYKDGVTLILLIEDFAKMQGIDGAILDAIIQRSTKEDPLCTIRTALACTNGYYEKLSDTFRTRTDFTVWVEYDNADKINYNSFVAHYLNATRVGTEELARNFQYHKELKDDHEWVVPNACSNCVHQPECHAAFGAYDGKGLYPFNESAARNLYDRLNYRSFTPRQFIGKAIKEVMHHFAPSIELGEFPNKNLLSYFGGKITKLMPKQQQDIEIQYGKFIADKTLPLIEFWSDGSRGIETGIFTAFDLPVIAINGTLSVAPRSLKEDSTNSVSIKEPQPNEEKLRVVFPVAFHQFAEWLNGQKIDQSTQREVRKLLYESISNFINWDELGLIRTEFFGSGPQYMFKPEYIEFLTPGETLITSPKLQLLLPLSEDERRSSAMALQGLVLYGHYGSWDFDEDKAYFRAFSKHLRQWSSHIVKKITTYSLEDRQWNPLQSILQWMYWGARLSGNIRHDDTSLVEIWDRMNDPLNFKHLEQRSQAFKQISNKLQTTSLLDQLFAHGLCPKGSSKGVKYFDLRKVIPLVKEVHKNGKPIIVVPRDVGKRYEFLSQLDQVYESYFTKAIQDEIINNESWLSPIQDALGDENVSEVFSQIRIALSKVENDGLGHLLKGSLYENVNEFLTKNTVKVDNAINNALRIEEMSTDVNSNFREISSRIGRADLFKKMYESSISVRNTEILLLRVQQYIQDRVESKLQANSGSLEGAKYKIQEQLDNLISLSNELEKMSEEK